MRLSPINTLYQHCEIADNSRIEYRIEYIYFVNKKYRKHSEDKNNEII